MITEDYVSFETAKLLKEKGFKSDCCHTAYDCNGEFFWHGDYSKDRKGIMDAPTLQMAMKWLLDTYKLHIVPTPYPHEDGEFYWAYKITFLDSDTLAVMVVKQKAGFDSKENACEGAIKYCLENLI